VQLKDNIDAVAKSFKSGISGSVSNITRAISQVFTLEHEEKIYMKSSKVTVDFHDLESFKD
jgi:hypothetical protein